jgi:hypothetical protein
MGSVLGFLIGALVGCYVTYAILDWAIFKRIIPDRFTSRILAGIATYLASVLVYGFGAENDGEFRFDGFIIFLVPSLVVLALAIKQGRDERDEPARKALGSS